jgi:hypothetical protein
MFKFNKQLTVLALLTVTSVSGAILTVTNVSAQNRPSGVVKDVTLWDGTNRRGASFDSNKGVPDLSKVGFDNRAYNDNHSRKEAVVYGDRFTRN